MCGCGLPAKFKLGAKCPRIQVPPAELGRAKQKTLVFLCVFEPLLEKRSATQLVFPKGEMLKNYCFDLGSFGIFFGIQKNKAFFFEGKTPKFLFFLLKKHT